MKYTNKVIILTILLLWYYLIRRILYLLAIIIIIIIIDTVSHSIFKPFLLHTMSKYNIKYYTTIKYIKTRMTSTTEKLNKSK